MKLKDILKRCLSVALSISMGVSLIPYTSLATATSTSLTDVDLRESTGLTGVTMAEGIEYIDVHDAEAEGHHFLLGTSMLKYNDMWICAYGQGKTLENDGASRFACKYSYDDMKTWTEEYVIADADGAEDTDGDGVYDSWTDSDGDGTYDAWARSHGVLYSDGETAWAFGPYAFFDATTDYDGQMKMEAYTLNDDLSWTNKGVVCEDFWPLAEPIEIADNKLLIAGLDCREGKTWSGAVAIADKDDLLNWDVYFIPNGNSLGLWGETAVINYGDKLVAFVRTAGEGYFAVSESTDNGVTWSDLVVSDFVAAGSKPYGGVLSNGSKYLIYNYDSARSKLVIAIGEPDGSYGFTKQYFIRDGFEKESVYPFKQGWAYPYAVEEDGYLYIGYAENKQNCEIAKVPISSLNSSSCYDTENQYYCNSYANESELPEYKEILELVDGTDSWFSGDGYKTGTDEENIDYTATIDGVSYDNVVARTQVDKAYTANGKAQQTVRRSFDLDYSKINDLDNLAFAITFYSAKEGSALTTGNDRMYFGSGTLKEGATNLKVPGNYTLDSSKQINYKANSTIEGYDTNLWSTVQKGWNTWLISFKELAKISGNAATYDDLNTFFMVMTNGDTSLNGEIIYALKSVKIVEVNKTSITSSAGENGTIYPKGLISLNKGEDRDFTISPKAGYRVADVKVDGISVGATNLYTFNDVKVPHTIEATFEKDDTLDETTDASTEEVAVFVQNYTDESELPEHTEILELVDGTDSWFSGDGYKTGTDEENIDYTATIDGVSYDNVVARTQVDKAYTANGKAQQTVRRSFDLDYSKINDLDNLAFAITFYSAKEGSALTTGNDRMYFGSGTLKEGATNLKVPKNYTLDSSKAINYKANATIAGYSTNLWSTVQKGWNTWLINFSELTKISGNASTYDDLNTFFMVMTNGDTSLNGEIIYALKSVKIVEVTEKVTGDVDTYTVTASAGTNGSVYVPGDATVNSGKSKTVYVSADAGYEISDVKVDGVSVGAVDSYTLDNIEKSHSVEATFERVEYSISFAGTTEKANEVKCEMKDCGELLTGYHKDKYIIGWTLNGEKVTQFNKTMRTEYVADYIDLDMLDVAWQQNTTNESIFRLISSVNTLDKYSGVGFEFSLDNNTWYDLGSTRQVYSVIQEGDNQTTAATLYGDYAISVFVQPVNFGSQKEVYVRSYVKLVGAGTKVYGDVSRKCVDKYGYDACIGDTYYETLQAAISAVPTDGTQTEIQLLKNIRLSTYLDIGNGNTKQNIVLTDDGKGPYTIGRADTYTSDKLFVVRKNSTLTVKGSSADNENPSLVLNGDLRDGTKVNHSVFKIGASEANAGGTLYLEDGVQVTSTYNSGVAGAFLINGGKVVMNGGILKDSVTDTNGGAIFIQYGGTFTMKGGSIVDNETAGQGGAIHIKNGTVDIQGGTISNNISAGEGGAIYCRAAGTVNMTGGTISNNTATKEGGAICILGNGSFTMSGGEISDNDTLKAGGAVCLLVSDGICGTVTLMGGTISGNHAETRGGAIFVHANGTLNVSNATITKNSSVKEGGAILLWENDKGAATMTMSGGTISENISNLNGGGVAMLGVSDTYSGANTSLTVSGGTISGNTAVYGKDVYALGTLTISGTATVGKYGTD